MSLGPFDLSGGPFLTLYIVLLTCTIVAGFVIPHWLRPEGRAARVTDPEKLAVLAGGSGRLTDAVIGRLLSNDALAISSKNRLAAVHGAEGRTTAERSVLAIARDGVVSAQRIDRALEPEADKIEREFVSNGLVMNHAVTNQMRFWQSSPYLLLVAFGLIKVAVGEARDRPVGFLIALLILTAVLAIARFALVDRKTRAAVALLAGLRGDNDRLRRAPSGDEAGLAVALFGTVVLAGSPWAGYHSMRTAGSSDAGSSGGDGGSSGGGCGGGGGGGGGGGCGGCSS